MSQGNIGEDQFKSLLSGYKPEAQTGPTVPSGFHVTKEKKEQAKEFLRLTEQSLGMNRKPVHKVSDDRPRRRVARAAAKPRADVRSETPMEPQQDLKELLHESVEMVASGTSPREMAIFLLEGGGRAKK